MKSIILVLFINSVIFSKQLLLFKCGNIITGQIRLYGEKNEHGDLIYEGHIRNKWDYATFKTKATDSPHHYMTSGAFYYFPIEDTFLKNSYRNPDGNIPRVPDGAILTYIKTRPDYFYTTSLVLSYFGQRSGESFGGKSLFMFCKSFPHNLKTISLK